MEDDMTSTYTASVKFDNITLWALGDCQGTDPVAFIQMGSNKWKQIYKGDTVKVKHFSVTWDGTISEQSFYVVDHEGKEIEFDGQSTNPMPCSMFPTTQPAPSGESYFQYAVNFLNNGTGTPTLVFYPGTPAPSSLIGETIGTLVAAPDNAIVMYSQFPGQANNQINVITGQGVYSVGSDDIPDLYQAFDSTLSAVSNGTLFYCVLTLSQYDTIEQVYPFQEIISDGSLILPTLPPSPTPVSGGLEEMSGFLTNFSNQSNLNQVILSPTPITWYSYPPGLAQVQQVPAATGGIDASQLLFTTPGGQPTEGYADPDEFLDEQITALGTGYAYLIVLTLQSLPVSCSQVISFTNTTPPPPPIVPNSPISTQTKILIGATIAVVVFIIIFGIYLIV